MTIQEEFQYFIEHCSKSPGSFKNYNGGLGTLVNARLSQLVPDYSGIYDYTSPETVSGFIDILKADSVFTQRDESSKANRMYSNALASYLQFLKEREFFSKPRTANNKQLVSEKSLQQIFYGAPGTGKSLKIKAQLEGVPAENIFRTTFHPDSDYSTFVGAYKPTMEKAVDRIYSKGELISKLTEMKEAGVPYSSKKFGAKYWRSLKQLTLSDKNEILHSCGMSDNFTVEFDKGVAVGEEYLAGAQESRIVYSFVPQAFLNAYVQAYKKPDENVYLIIEEINRGNCAQVFGDLFQLLDREETGVSEYPIKADADLKAYLLEELGEDNTGIKDGELRLPANLYIWATMNTSDQSLFPIDSAFKRRWDSEYEPIKYNNTGWKIVIADKEYSWVSFQRIVNGKILNATSSEDKMLGDYFVNPPDGIIAAKVLINKILFYLWTDVCKDGEGEIFKTSETEDVSFSELYGEGGTEKLTQMMTYLKVTDLNGNKVPVNGEGDNVESQSE